jgi:rubrerythrin
MDIFQFAMDKEKYSEEFYRHLAERTSNAGLRNILMMLAGEEVKHYHVVERMKAETRAEGHGLPGQEVTDTPVLANAKAIFEKMRSSMDRFDFDVSEADLYRKACDIEEQSRDFYLEKAEEAENPAHKALFRKLAEEEEKHWRIVEGIRSFVAQPETYLENAEFDHIEDYAEGEY